MAAALFNGIMLKRYAPTHLAVAGTLSASVPPFQVTVSLLQVEGACRSESWAPARCCSGFKLTLPRATGLLQVNKGGKVRGRL